MSRVLIVLESYTLPEEMREPGKVYPTLTGMNIKIVRNDPPVRAKRKRQQKYGPERTYRWRGSRLQSMPLYSMRAWGTQPVRPRWRERLPKIKEYEEALSIMDLREVERRLKARPRKEDE